MSEDTRTLPSGAGATTHSTSSDARRNASSKTEGPRSYSPSRPSGGSPSTGRRIPPSRSLVVTEQRSERPSTGAVVGAALVGAIAGASIPFMLARRSTQGSRTSETDVVQESVTINRPARELYDFWRNFTNLPRFMDNIKSVEKLDERRSRWVIKAPAGASIEFDSRVVEDVPGKLIAWESEEGASVPNRGRVEFAESSKAGATVVRATISYDPPAGAAGRLVAKLFQREPGQQAREDLARLRDLMEKGRVR